MPQVGPTELIIILVIVLLVFGPKRLPMLGRQLGGGMREFKNSITGKDKDKEDDELDDEARAKVADDAQDPNAALGRPELSSPPQPTPAMDPPPADPFADAETATAKPAPTTDRPAG